MKNQNTIKIIAFIFTAVIILALIPINTTVFAGRSGNDIIDNSMMSGDNIGIDNWKYNDGGLSMTNGVIHFDNTYGLNNPLLSRTQAKSSTEIEKALEVSFSISDLEIVGDKEFGFVYGIPKLNKNVGETNSTFLYFCNNNSNLCFGIKHFASSGERQLLNEQNLVAVNNAFAFKIDIYSDGRLNVTINNEAVYVSQSEGETVANGFLGFSSMGGYTTKTNYLDAKVYGCYVKNCYYDKPSTPMISYADFNANEYNSNEWFVNSFVQDGSGAGVVANDGVLKFDGASQNSNFSPRYAYSNFELEFDIFDVDNEVTEIGNGKKKIASSWCGISWGTAGDDVESVAQSYNIANFLYFDADRNMPKKTDGSGNTVFDVDNPDFGTRIDGTVMRYKKGSGWQAVTLPKKFSFFDNGFTDKVRIRLRVIDGVTTLSMKLVDEIEYTEIFKFVDKTDSQQTGYINIRGEGNKFTGDYKYYSYCSSFSIDNVSIKNYDANPNLVEVSYTTNRLKVIPDSIYLDPYTDDYLIANTKGKALDK